MRLWILESNELWSKGLRGEKCSVYQGLEAQIPAFIFIFIFGPALLPYQGHMRCSIWPWYGNNAGPKIKNKKKLVFVLLALDKLNIFLPSTFSIRAHLIPGFTISFWVSKSLLCICYFSCNFTCARYSPNIITGPDSPCKIVQLCLFNHVNPWSTSYVIACSKFSFYEIWLSPSSDGIQSPHCPDRTSRDGTE